MTEQWIVFDLIGVLAEPSWREITSEPDLERWSAFRCGKDSEDNFWQKDLAALYRAMLGFRADRLDIVKSLRGRGYKICIATNFATAWYETLLGQLDDKELFAEAVISSEIGVAKPDDGFWHELLERVPRGSVFVDDRKVNCEAAAKAGFRAVWAYPGAPIRERIDELLAEVN